MGWVKAGGSKQMVANSLLCHAPHVSDQFAPLSSQRYIPNTYRIARFTHVEHANSELLLSL